MITRKKNFFRQLYNTHRINKLAVSNKTPLQQYM